MLCKKGHNVSRLVHYADGSELCPVCDNISPIGKRLSEPFRSFAHQQNIERQRNQHYKDLLQPWSPKKGETSKGLQPNPEYIKAYKNDPKALQHFTKEELKKSGV